jgi:hypothetical protein
MVDGTSVVLDVLETAEQLPAFQYHDLGNQKTARFGQLPNASERDGFTLSFTGGEDDRASVIHYQWYVVRFYYNSNSEATMSGWCLMS